MTRLVCIAAGLLLAAPASAQRGMGLIRMNEPFPELTLPSLKDGSPASLADFRGRKVVLHVFASW
jgi:hypothetical protein